MGACALHGWCSRGFKRRLSGGWWGVGLSDVPLSQSRVSWAAALNFAHTPLMSFPVLPHALPCMHVGLVP